MHLKITLACIFCFAFLKAAPQQHVESNLSKLKIEGLSKEVNTNYFLIVGDWGRNGQGDQQNVANWMGVAANQVNAKFVISTGDNFYCCGVASTTDFQWISSFENVFRSHSLQIPWYAALGNHDYQGNVKAQINYTQVSQRWKMPDRYFTKAIGNVRLVVIDTSPFIGSYYLRKELYTDLPQQDTTRQLVWLDSVLTAAPEKYKIVVGHHPVYSVGEHGSEPDMKRMVEGKLEKHHVNIYFAGHDHSLQSLMVKDKSVHHLISGGGSEFTPVRNDLAITRFARGTSGFMLAAVKDDAITVYFISSEGKIIYKETVSP